MLLLCCILRRQCKEVRRRAHTELMLLLCCILRRQCKEVQRRTHTEVMLLLHCILRGQCNEVQRKAHTELMLLLFCMLRQQHIRPTHRVPTPLAFCCSRHYDVRYKKSSSRCVTIFRRQCKGPTQQRAHTQDPDPLTTCSCDCPVLENFVFVIILRRQRKDPSKRPTHKTLTLLEPVRVIVQSLKTLFLL